VRQKERLKIEAWQTPARAILDTKINTANRSGLIDMPTGRSLDDIKSTVIGLKPKISRTGKCCPHGWIAMGRSRSWEIVERAGASVLSIPKFETWLRKMIRTSESGP
jgi:hypothetical protein